MNIEENKEKVSKSSNLCTLFGVISYLHNPNYRPYRYTIVILLWYIHAMFAFCADFPAGMQSIIIQVMEIDSKKYNLLFSSYTWCDIVISTAGSIVINKYLGVHVGIIGINLILFLAQLIVSLGAYLNSFIIMLIGRIAIGLGGGCLTSVISCFEFKWFSGKEVTFVMSLNRSFVRFMATLALISPLLIYDKLDFISSPYCRHGATQMVGTFFCLLGVVFSFIVVLLDKHGTKTVERNLYNIGVARKFSVVDIKDFPLAFWIVSMICGTYYAIAFSSTANAPLFLMSKYDFSAIHANFANSLSYSSAIIISPFIGLLIDKTGYNLLWVTLGISLIILLNTVYIMSRNGDTFVPFLAAALFSLSYCFFGTAIWVCIGFLIPEHQLTTAFGIAMSIYALAVSLVGLLSGVTIDLLGYLFLMIIFILLMFMTGLLSIFLSLLEYFDEKRVLNVFGKARLNKS